ncbi:MAG: hypothetical protein ACXAEX_23175 [Promethearchaeota archaeon]|jgi:hypothetical protein
MRLIEKFRHVIRDKNSQRYGLILGFVYFLIYLWSIGNITIIQMPEVFMFRIVENWRQTIFKPIAPFLWEAIAKFYVYGGLVIFISVPNILLDLLLSGLVYINISLAFYSYYIYPLRPGVIGLISLVPSLFTGFVCCVPTIILTLGAVSTSFTAFFIALRPFLIPLSVLVMLINIWWTLNHMQEELIDIYESEKLLED